MTQKYKYPFLLLLFVFFFSFSSKAQEKLLNVSYDVSREFYKDYNAKFAEYWKSKSGKTLEIQQSHAGSSKQARSVIDGLEADVVTLNQQTDIDAISEKGKLLPSNWRSRLANNSSPFTSTILFLVRKGNPKQINDWSDLVKPGISVIIPNPKTSGNGRYSYLAAWAYALAKNSGDENKAKEFVRQVFKNVPVLDTGGRGATTTFIQRGIGDVLLTFENEIFLTQKEEGKNKFDIVYPSQSIEAELPVAWIDKNVAKHNTEAQAKAYLEYLYTPEGQELAAQHYLRPRLPEVLKKYQNQFQKINLISIDQALGGWQKAQAKHFADGEVFDQIYGK